MANAKKDRRALNGLLLLDKPAGCTSNHALQRVKRLFNARKAGHTGSLDPLATGMLPVCFGEATKVSAYLLDSDKTYRVSAVLGQRRDTADSDGAVVEEAPIPDLAADRVEAVLRGFLGDSEQVPPMYSALKIEGQRLYELARKGETVERVPRPITIHEIRLIDHLAGQISFEVRCSKGTYVRTLVEDVAARLGTLGHVGALRRIGVGAFEGEEMWTLEQLENLADAGDLERTLLPVDQALRDWPAVALDSAAIARLNMGQRVAAPAKVPVGHIRLYEQCCGFAGVAEASLDGSLIPRRMFPALREKTPGAGAK